MLYKCLVDIECLRMKGYQYVRQVACLVFIGIFGWQVKSEYILEMKVTY